VQIIMGRFMVEYKDKRRNVRIKNNAWIQDVMRGYGLECKDTRRNVSVQNNARIQNRM
jgi:hypothetical protein